MKARAPVPCNSESKAYVCVEYALRFAAVQHISLLLVSSVCSLSKHGRAGEN